MRILFHWIIATAALLIATAIVPGASITLSGALIAAVVLGALNLFIRPILVILTFPITVITLGFFSLVINALLVMLAAAIVPGFSIAGFWTALFFALVLSIVNWVFHVWKAS